MKSGGGKQKGSAFEREICKALSLWISGGKREDLFWRTAMSGGRATVHFNKPLKGIKKPPHIRQVGDICAVAPEGHAFCEAFFIECKHVKRLALDQFIVKGTGPLAAFWKKARVESIKRNMHTMIIARQNGWPVMVFYNERDLFQRLPQASFSRRGVYMMAFDDLLKTKPPKLKAVRR
jgi:hypothetical protein